MELKEETTEEGYRLAPYLLRLASFAIDSALALLLGLLLYFVSFPNGSFSTLGDALGVSAELTTLRSYQKASGLLVVSSDGVLSDVSSSSYEDYEQAIKSYYFTYNALDNPVNPHPEGYTIPQYNVAVLGLPLSSDLVNSSAYYEFQTKDGKADPEQLGVLKASLYVDGALPSSVRESLLSYYQKAYKATQDLLLNETYYRAVDSAYSGHVELLEALMIFIPFLVFFFAIPMFSRDSRSLGKRWMKLAVMGVEGLPLNKWWLLLRSAPFLLTVLAAIILNDILISFSLGILVFLVSTGLASFSKKRRALHDFCARSVVVRDEQVLAVAEEEHA